MMGEHQWDIERFAASLREHVARRLAKAALIVVAQHQKNLSVANPAPHHTPAPRGQFPRGRTFFLRANVGFAPHTIAEIAAAGAVRVGVFEAAKYGVYLKGKGWLGVSDSYAQVRPDIAKVFSGERL